MAPPPMILLSTMKQDICIQATPGNVHLLGVDIFLEIETLRRAPSPWATIERLLKTLMAIHDEKPSPGCSSVEGPAFSGLVIGERRMFASHVQSASVVHRLHPQWPKVGMLFSLSPTTVTSIPLAKV